MEAVCMFIRKKLTYIARSIDLIEFFLYFGERCAQHKLHLVKGAVGGFVK